MKDELRAYEKLSIFADLFNEIRGLEEKLSAYHQAFGVLTTLAPGMVIDIKDPVGMAKTIERKIRRDSSRQTHELVRNVEALRAVQERAARLSAYFDPRDGGQGDLTGDARRLRFALIYLRRFYEEEEGSEPTMCPTCGSRDRGSKRHNLPCPDPFHIGGVPVLKMPCPKCGKLFEGGTTHACYGKKSGAD